MQRFRRVFFSMKFALLLLGILIVACIAGSILPQGELASYYMSAYPQNIAGAILALGLDDVFHCLWFVVLTIILCLNLIAMVLYALFFVLKKEACGKWAEYITTAAFVFLTGALVIRGIGAGRLPLSNQYEFATSFAWGICACYLIFLWRYHFRALGAFVLPVIFLIIGYAAMQSKKVRELMPALRSNWLAIHVSSAIISSGAIWAEHAWGSYWSWDPKETWSLITRFIYAIYLHLRITKGWKGKSAALFAVIGFVCVIFTYIGVNTLLPGVHSYT